MTHYQGFNGVRGVAALAVFLVHFNQIVQLDIQIGPIDIYRLFANGEYGVAVFFILSGMLLSQPYWQAILQQGCWPNPKVFFLHRIARVFPAYFIVLTGIVLTTDYWRYAQAWPDILLHYSFLFNYAEFSFFSLNPPFWTLAVEIQFYCLLPFIFCCIRRVSFLRATCYLLFLAMLSYVAHYLVSTLVKTTVLWPSDANLIWIKPYGAVVSHSLFAHLPHFILGMIAGGILLISVSKAELNKVAPYKVNRKLYDAIVAIGIILCFVLLSTPLSDYIAIPFGRYGLPLIPLFIAAIMISLPQSNYAAKVFENSVLKQLGFISYGVYIYHFPALSIADRQLANWGYDAQQYWGIFGLFALLLTLTLATLSYYLIERPMSHFVNQK